MTAHHLAAVFIPNESPVKMLMKKFFP